MTDARFPERWLTDARLQRASAGAYRLFGNALMWAVSNRTDGQIPPWALALIPHASAADADELVDAGLWDADPSGWVIDGYEDTQSTKADLDALANARKRQRDKMRRRRAAAQQPVTGTVPGDVPGHSSAHSTRTGQARTGQALRTEGSRQAPADFGRPSSEAARQSSPSQSRKSAEITTARTDLATDDQQNPATQLQDASHQTVTRASGGFFERAIS